MSELQDRIATLTAQHPPETDVSVWAIKVALMLAAFIGQRENYTKEEILEAMEVMYVISPDSVNEAVGYYVQQATEILGEQ